VSKSAPSPPDYVGAAQAQSQASQDISEQQTFANRPTVNTPFGGQNWTTKTVMDPVTGKPVNQWTQNVTLNPALQNAVTKEQGITSGQADLASTLLAQEQAQEKTPIDFSKMLQVEGAPTATTTNTMPGASAYDKTAADAAFNEYLGYNAPLQKQATDQLDTQLRNQGLQPGDQAYDTAMTNLRNQQSSANQQAEYQGVLTGSTVGQQQQAADLAAQQQRFGQEVTGVQTNNAAAAQQIAQEMQKRGFTLNQISAILSGNQVGMPQTPGYATAGAGQAPNLLGASQAQGQAANDIFSTQQAQQGSEIGGAATIAMAIAYMY
jgi:hypothetical protein